MSPPKLAADAPILQAAHPVLINFRPALRMELHVFTENEAAIRFYERTGYERIARRRRFYGAEGLDAFEYRKELAGL